MSKKRSIIIFSVIAALTVVLILSSTLFRIRKQNVEFTSAIEGVSEIDIQNASGIKNGKSVFLINKEKTKQNIEKLVPYAKVENIYITFPNAINYVISNRTDFCFFERDGSYFICDNFLKVLRTSSEKPDLIEIDKDENAGVGDFIANSQILALFATFNETISLDIGEIKSGEFSLNDAEIISSVSKISFNNETSKLEVQFKENFTIIYSLNNFVERKHYFLMGIIRNNNSSILSPEERCDGKVFELQSLDSGEIRKIPIEI